MKNLLYLYAILLVAGAGNAYGADFPAQGVERIELKVDGLACPFCSKGLEMRLRKVDRVADTTINLEKGIAEISFEKTAPPDFRALWEAVGEAGFTPSKLRIVAVGNLQGTGDDLRLSISLPKNSLIITLKNGESLIEDMNTSVNKIIVASANFHQGPKFNLESVETTASTSSH